nr:hypothetical protein [Pararobbsia alpina]
MIRRDAVLQAMNAARILGDVTAYCSYRLTRRIRHVTQAKRLDRFRDLDVRHARLNTGDAIVRVNFENAAHARCAEQDGILER